MNSENDEGPSYMRGWVPRPGTSASDASPDDNSHVHNDCSKSCSGASAGVMTKVRHFNNISNGTDPPNNNPEDTTNCVRLQSVASTSQADSPDLDGYMRNNVDSPSDVEKCPSKVRNGSIDGAARRKCRRPQCSLGDDSSSGNEAEEECCVYTYKGCLQADLPSSFFTLDRLANGLENPVDEPVREPPVQENNRSAAGSSPDNDFLEMDFDPGPSMDQDSEEEIAVENEASVSPVPELPSERDEENDLSAVNETVESTMCVNNVTDRRHELEDEPQPGPSSPSSHYVPSMQPTLAQKRSVVRETWTLHRLSGDLCSPWEMSDADVGLGTASKMILDYEPVSDTKKYNHFSDLFHSAMAKRLVMGKNESFTDVASTDSQDTFELQDGTMIWSEQEACTKQVTQISTSACGVTAIINVMVALNMPFSLEKLKQGVGTRLRQESAPLIPYLISRCHAGATHQDLIRGIHLASENRLFARFFAMYPERDFSLSKWLSYWIKKGSVPIATLNLQVGLSKDALLPDAWHHQMIFGVSPRGVYLTNPLECVPEEALLPQLCSPSVLKVKTSEVQQRWTATTDLRPLMCQKDIAWKKCNVLGQVINIVRESASTAALNAKTIPTHITIPASYSSGITLVIATDSPAFEELSTCPELPFISRIDH